MDIEGKRMLTTTRRTFLKGSGLLTAAGFFRMQGMPAWAAGAGETQLDQFPYGDVELLEGPMLEQFRANHQRFLTLSSDAMLKPFRQAAGMPAPGEDMGGWYSWAAEFNPPGDMTGYIPGHSFGQYLSGLARAYAVTGDPATKAKVDELVTGFAPTVTTKFYAHYPLPCYTYDKTSCGMLDAHQYAGNPDAMAVLSHATDAVLPWLPANALKLNIYKEPHPNVAYEWDEPYTLPENLFLAYKLSGDPRYKDLAVRFLADQNYFDPLAAGVNVLPHQHAYSHVNALSSASQAWLVLGDEKYKRAALNGFHFVVDTQSFATGGWGPNESFRVPGSGDMDKSLTDTHASFETPCGAYGHFKIVRYLTRFTGQSLYGDSMETVLYNTILGALPIQADGTSYYYSDYNNSGSKVYYGEKWPCCSGTFPQVTADYGISSYFRAPGAVYVNLFVPSRVHWQQGSTRLSLEQRTSYPAAPRVTMLIGASSPAEFALNLRVPAWAGPGTYAEVNGKRVAGLTPGTFTPIHREWKQGDRVEYVIDMAARLEPISPDHTDTVALAVGPQVLFAVGAPDAVFTRKQLLAAKQKSAGSNEWEVASSQGPVTFRTFPSIGQHETYRLYHVVTV